jgi:hypothetical protein
MTDNVLSDSDSSPNTFTFDPTNIETGVYTVSVQVTDDGLPSMSVSASINLKLVQNLPNLSSSIDSDGDGISDVSEGHQDSDFDGIPDYLDHINGSSLLQLNVGSDAENDNSYLMQVESGLSLTLGKVALTDAEGGARLSSDIVSTNELFTQYGNDSSFNNVGGYYDFEVHNISPVGSSALVVIPLSDAIPQDASYRKLHPDHGWQDFIIDSNNKLYSAAGQAGVCPSPGNIDYQPGLTEGHFCLMMLIQDGGENDADGIANGTIVDPGGIATTQSVPDQTTEEPVKKKKSGGGSADSILLVLSLLALLGMRRRLFKRL